MFIVCYDNNSATWNSGRLLTSVYIFPIYTPVMPIAISMKPPTSHIDRISAADIRTLIQRIQREVQRKFNVRLEPEIKMVGRDVAGNGK